MRWLLPFVVLPFPALAEPLAKIDITVGSTTITSTKIIDIYAAIPGKEFRQAFNDNVPPDDPPFADKLFTAVIKPGATQIRTRAWLDVANSYLTNGKVDLILIRMRNEPLTSASDSLQGEALTLGLPSEKVDLQGHQITGILLDVVESENAEGDQVFDVDLRIEGRRLGLGDLNLSDN